MVLLRVREPVAGLVCDSNVIRNAFGQWPHLERLQKASELEEGII